MEIEFSSRPPRPAPLLVDERILSDALNRVKEEHTGNMLSQSVTIVIAAAEKLCDLMQEGVL